MRILAISDVEVPSLYAHFDPARLEDVDLILCAGDLPSAYVEFIVTMARVPVVAVRGNHDAGEGYQTPGGCISAEGRIVEVAGLKILGLGGSIAYRPGIFAFSERDMYWRMLPLSLRAKAAGGIDILLTHAPARGCGDLEDLPHRGFKAFNTCLEMLKPPLMVHGHVHQDYGRVPRESVHPCGTRIINACGAYEFDYA